MVIGMIIAVAGAINSWNKMMEAEIRKRKEIESIRAVRTDIEQKIKQVTDAANNEICSE